MKAVCSMIFTSLLLSASVLFPSTAGAAVCQNTTVVVYSNGMFNIKKYARDSLSELQDSLINYSTVFGDVTKYEYKLAYASGGSQYVPQVGGTGWKIKLINRILALPNFFGQLGEVVFQKMLQDDYSAYWRWLAGLQAAGSRTQNVMNQLAAATNAASYLNTPELDAQLVMYRQALNSGKRVLIISHSQGNFYANAAYTRLISENPAWSKSIGNVQVATPAAANLASKLGNNKPHITVPEDLVMKAVRLSHLFLNVLPTKPTNPFANSPNMKELSPNNSTAYSDATYGHNFVTWYLAGTYTRDFIMKGIVDTINGYSWGAYTGLQYSKKCALSPPIPQPGPFYYRDDWGDLTHDKIIPDFSPGWVVQDPHRQFKHLRDDRRGLAYKVQLSQKYDRASGWYTGAHQIVLGITDYSTNQFQRLYYTFPDTFVPDDVVLWSGGILFLKYTNFHPSNDISSQIEWRKFTINDNGIALPGRWAINNITSGVFNFPTYNHTGLKYFPLASGGGYQYVATPDNVWRKVGMAYREGSSYTYRTPYLARLAEWTNAPGGRYNALFNGNQSPPIVSRKTYLGDFGSLEIIDGSFAFVKEGRVPLEKINGVQPALKPVVNGFSKIKQSMAYKYTQSFLGDAAMVNEAEALGWGDGSGGYYSLQATLGNGELFFKLPAMHHRLYWNGSVFYPYSEIFIPFSLSNSMSMLWASNVSLPQFNQLSSSYKLNPSFRIKSTDTRFQLTNPPIRMPVINRATDVVQVTAEQKVFMENATNSVP